MKLYIEEKLEKSNSESGSEENAREDYKYDQVYFSDGGESLEFSPKLKRIVERCSVTKLWILKRERQNGQGEDFLPADPMQWNPYDVVDWVKLMSHRHHFKLDVSQFIMNGKGLCLMSLDGFRYRCPEGGDILHTDLRRKLILRLFIEGSRIMERKYDCFEKIR